MQIHKLKRNTPNKKSAQVGRGGTRGKTSGRGTKGQKARAGNKRRPHIRDIIKKLPKLRGRGKNSFVSFELKPAVVNLSAIEANFKAGDIVTPAILLEKKLVKRIRGVTPKVKLLGTGEITKKIIFSKILVSESAKSKIAATGGEIRK